MFQNDKIRSLPSTRVLVLGDGVGMTSATILNMNLKRQRFTSHIKANTSFKMVCVIINAWSVCAKRFPKSDLSCTSWILVISWKCLIHTIHVYILHPFFLTFSLSLRSTAWQHLQVFLCPRRFVRYRNIIMRIIAVLLANNYQSPLAALLVGALSNDMDWH